MRRAGGLALPIRPRGKRLLRDHRLARPASVPGASTDARPRPQPARVRPTGSMAGRAVRIPSGGADRTIGTSSSQPGNGSPGSGRSRAGTPDSCSRSPISASSARDFWYSVNGSSSASSTFWIDRCDSTSKRRMDSIRSPNRSTRTGLADSGREDVQDAAAHGVFADHFHRLAALVSDAFQVCDDILQRHFVADAQVERELPVEVAGLDAQQRRRYRHDGDGDAAGGQPPQADGALLADLGVRRHGSASAGHPAREAVAGRRPSRPATSRE